MDDSSVSVPGGIDMLGYLCILFVKISVILCKLLSVLGVSRQNFCPRVGKQLCHPWGGGGLLNGIAQWTHSVTHYSTMHDCIHTKLRQ